MDFLQSIQIKTVLPLSPILSRSPNQSLNQNPHHSRPGLVAGLYLLKRELKIFRKPGKINKKLKCEKYDISKNRVLKKPSICKQLKLFSCGRRKALRKFYVNACCT